MATSTRSRYFTILSAVALLFTMLTPLAAVAQDPPEGSWDFVTSVPGSDEGRIATSVWTGERDVVYALTRTGATPYDMQVQRFDHGSWHLELDMPGYLGTFLFGTAPDDIYVSGYTCLQPDDSWTCPSGGADDVAVYHYDGVDWSRLTMPPELDGVIANAIAGVPGEVQIAARPFVVRNTGSDWAVVHDATGLNIHPNVMTLVAPDEGYFASCWGHAVWDGVTWTEKVEFDFCDLADAWGARTGSGDLNLWVTGNNNFSNGVRIWRFDEANQSFGAKYSPEFADPAPASDTTHNVGSGSGLWGAAADDVFATGYLWDPYPDYRSGRIYHFDGAGWTRLTGMGEIPAVFDVSGTASDDAWFSLDDGRLLHYGTTPEYAADWSFRVETPHDIWSEGGSWAIGTDILVLVNDGESGAEFAETVQVEQWGSEPSDVGWWVNTGDFEIEPGDLVTVYDDSGSKNLEVLALTIDVVDMHADSISGSAPPDTTFPVHASDGTTDAGFEVTSDGGGAWSADFAGLFDIRAGTGGSAAIFDAENDATHRGWNIQMPELNVTPDNDMVDGYYFELGATVTVEIDDPTNGVGVDWSDSDVAALPPWGADHSYVTFAPADDGFDVVAGHIVTMSDGTTTKTLEVSPLAITDVDAANDLVQGTATPDGAIWVWVGDGQDPGRETVVAGDGNWTVDYKLAQGDSGPLDIGPGDAVDANEYDDDGDTTHAYLGVPSPYFSVETPNQIWSHGDGWIAGRTVTITVNDGVSDVYSTTAPVVAWGPSPWEVGWSTDTGGFEILPGHVVTVDDGVDIVRTLDVVALEVTDVDEDTDTITGMAPANAWVNGNAGNEFEGANRRVQTDAGGFFTIDFGTPGVEDWEQDTIDLRPGIGGSVQVFEDDGDSTHRGWRAADPHFGVDVVHEELWANDWPIGATLNFQVFEPDDLVNPVWDDSMTVVDTTWGQTEAGYRFWGDFDVHGGQLITITDGSLSRELIVSTLVVTNVDPDTETYTGTVEDVDYDKTHEVCAWARDLIDGQQGVELCTIPDGDRNWTIDFTGVGEIIPGDHTGAYQNDPDGDQTSYAWFVPPWIYVEIGDDTNPDFPDRIHLDQWDFPVEVTNGTDTITATDTDNDGWEVVEFDVTPGETITATGNDGRVKNVYLEELSVDTVTLWNEDPPSTVYGSTTATYDGNVQVTASADYGWWTERWVDANAGAYEADFANPGNGWREQELGYFGQGGADDVYSGGEIRSHIWDADNDQVQAIWHATNPRIIIVRGNDRIEAIDFPKDEPLTIELDDPAFEGIEFSETGIPAANPDKPWETLLVFELGDYTVPDVATVTASDSTGTPLVTTEVIPFSIDLVDPDNDTITGTAAEGSEVLVQADGNWRYPIADATDTWVADFSQPGTQPGEENPVDIGPGSSGGATLIAEGGSATTVLWSLSNAAFSVDPDGEHIWGWEFASDASVTITIDGTGHGPFGTDGGGSFDVYFDPATVDVAEGTEVIVSDGETDKLHVVTALGITGVDEALDQVSGTAEEGTDVHVWVNETGANLDVTATDGTWLADFGGQADLGPGSNGGAQQSDDDGDSTHLGWLIFNPTVNVDPSGDGVWGEQWLPNDVVTIFINEVEHSTLSTDEWGNFGEGWDPQGLDIVAGDKVDVTQGDVTKTHFVTTLAITGIDIDTEIMTGTAAGPFDIWVHDTDAWRHVDHDGVGEWSVNWSMPGPNEGEEGTADLEPGVNGNSNECDLDGDCTWADWNVANPSFSVEAPHQVWSHGDGWVEGRTVTLVVDDDVDDLNGILYTDTVLVERWGPEPWEVGWGFDLSDVFEIEPAHYVTVDDGVEIEKSLSVEDVTITSIDEDNDTVTGTAPPLSRVEVNAETDGYGAQRSVEADVGGDWSADFSVAGDEGHEQDLFDIGLGTWGSAQVFDEDGDSTHRGWNIEEPPVPAFSVETPWYVWSNGEGWVEGRTIALMVDDNDDPTDGILYNDSTLVERWGPEPWEVGWSFALEDVFEILPGHYVSVYDGVEVEKTLLVEDLEITGIDEDADTITGIAPAMARILLNAGNDEYQVYRTVEADENGDWFVDLSVPGDAEGEQDVFDITVNTGGSAEVPDEDGDSTHRGWYVEAPPQPNFFVRPNGDEIWGSEWFGGPEVTVTIDDDDDPAEVLFEVVLETGDGEFYEGIAYDIVPGHYVVVTDGVFAKSHWVTPLTVTGVDADADMVHGTTGAGAEVFVGSDNGSYRVVTAGESGDWTADFSVPWEDQGVLDIVYGTGGYAEESDEDGDATHAGWQATASSATVEGHVYLDGAPLPDVEVWSSSDEVFTCTDSEGYFLFEDLSPVGDVLVATGPSYSDAGCGNTAFVDPDGMPLLVAGEGGLDLTDGYEYLEFNVEYAAAIQYVRVEDITGGSATPVNDVVIHAFDRNDEEFIAVFGHDPDPADYQAILDTGIGEIPWIDWTGAALDHEDGLAEVRYRYITDVLILAELDPVQGATSNADEFFENPDGIVEGPEIVFQIGEAGPIVTVDSLVLNEGDGASRVLITFRLSEPVSERVTVEWATADGSALAGEDYLAASGVVTFRPGRTEVWRRIQVLGDTDLEDDESFQIVLLSVAGAAAGDPGTITLINDDEPAPPEPELSVADAEVLEGDRGATRVAVTFTLTEPAPSLVSFTATTVGDTAMAGVDYSEVVRTVRIRAGNTSATMYVKVIGDTIPEADETFTVEISDVTGAEVADASGTVTILNDD